MVTNGNTRSVRLEPPILERDGGGDRARGRAAVSTRWKDRAAQRPAGFERGVPDAVRSEAGFTLLEMLVAITILAIGLMATVNMQTTALRANSFAQRTTSSSAVARAAMDELLSRPGADAIFQTAQVNAAYDLDLQTAATTQRVQGITYAGTITVTPDATVNGAPITNLTRIDLTVTGSDRTITLTELKRAL